MNIQEYPLMGGQWFPQPTRKRFVVWCGGGRVTGPADLWSLQANRVGAPYVVERDGTTYRTFDDSGWSYFLGIPGACGSYDQTSVGVELANGPAVEEEQVDAAIELTLDICRRHEIEPVFYYPSTAYDFPRCFRVATIVCRPNCCRGRRDLRLPEWAFTMIRSAGIAVRGDRALSAYRPRRAPRGTARRP